MSLSLSLSHARASHLQLILICVDLGCSDGAVYYAPGVLQSGANLPPVLWSFGAVVLYVLAYIQLTEEDNTSSSRIFIKILFQELSEHLGIRLLNERITDPAMQDSIESIFPKGNPKNTRFSINFFTSIGLGGITEN